MGRLDDVQLRVEYSVCPDYGFLLFQTEGVMSFRVFVLMSALIGFIASELLFWITMDIIYLIAACIIMFANIPNIVHVVRNN